MSAPAPLSVSPHEQGTIRIFQLDMDEANLRRLREPQRDDPSTGAAVAHLLGLDWLEADHLEIFDVADLDELGLAGFLEHGNGVAAGDIDRARLENVEGWVLVLYARAFGGKAATLRPDRRLALLGVWQEERDPIAFQPLPSEAAKGSVPPPPTKVPNPHLTVLWAILALPVLALIFGALIYGLTR